MLTATLVLDTLPATALADELEVFTSPSAVTASAAPAQEDEGQIAEMEPVSGEQAGDEAQADNVVTTQESSDDSAPTATGDTYTVSSNDELASALEEVAVSGATSATVILAGDDTYRSPTEDYVSTFGVAGTALTVTSEEGHRATLAFSSRGLLSGDCTFDNVKVTGRFLYCCGHDTLFTENSEIELSATLYGGGYKSDVASTHVVIAGTGSINPVATNGMHNVIGGSYQGSVDADTYLELSGSIAMQGGNYVTPGCVKGDGTSGDGSGVADVHVGGNATLVYDNKNVSASPAIAGGYGCEMMGDVTLDARSGRANEICGADGDDEKSAIHGNVHIIAGSEQYENTDTTLRLNSNWPIVGAGNRFATSPDYRETYHVDGNVTIDAYENVWGWDRGTDPASYDVPMIAGAIGGDVGGNVEINAHGCHMQDIEGADSSMVAGSVTINATDVELRNSDGDGDVYGLYYSTSAGPCTINVNDGNVDRILLTRDEEAPEGSSINITGKPTIRTGVISTWNMRSAPENAVVNIDACEASIPFIQSGTSVNVTGSSNVTIGGLWLVRDLSIEEGGTLTTRTLDIDPAPDALAELEGNATVNGTWEQRYTDASDGTYDVIIGGSMTVGSAGKFVNLGTTDVEGNVESSGLMALMALAFIGGGYVGNGAELRLPVADANYDGGSNGTAIPLQIAGASSGETTVNTVDPNDWQTLRVPKLGDNYILSAKQADDAPAQETFLLVNEDALSANLFLKRVADANTSSDVNHMWQVASGITLTFDKNGGDTEANLRVMTHDLVVGESCTFDLPATEPTREGYLFDGWNTKPDGSGDEFTAATPVSSSMTVYAQWKADPAYAVTISPMNLTVYTGGEGYSGVVGEDGTFASNDIPEMGFYVTLPDEINELLGSTPDNPVDLSGKVTLSYGDPSTGTTRSWALKLYGDESQSHVMMNGRRVYIYKIMPSSVDGTEETVPFRVQFRDSKGNVQTDTDFIASSRNQFQDYTASVYPGSLDTGLLRVNVVAADGQTQSRPVNFGTAKLRIRANNDEIYTPVFSSTPKVDPQNRKEILAGEAQEGTEYYVNDSGVRTTSDGIRLMVDHTLDDSVLSRYLDANDNASGKYSYEFRYLDLVDTNNGNAFVTMGAGQKMNVFWPVPADVASDSSFQVIHFKNLDRNDDSDADGLPDSYTAERLDCERVTLGGQDYVKFSVDSFSPFALMYQKAGTAPGTSGEAGATGGSAAAGATPVSQVSEGRELPQTGDELPAVFPVVVAGAVVLGAGVASSRRRRN